MVPPASRQPSYATGLANVSAFAFDTDGRLWAATAAYDDAGTDAVYEVTAAGATPLKVIADLHTPLGLVWVGDTLYVASAGRVDAYSRSRQRDVRAPHDGPDASGRCRRGQWPRPVTGRSSRSRRLGAVRRVHADHRGRGGGPLVPPRRIRPPRRRRRDPGAGRSGLLPGHRRPVRHDEPARRPRRRDAGRLAVARPRRPGVGLPGLLRPGWLGLRRRADARRGPRQARGGQRRRDRDRRARRARSAPRRWWRSGRRASSSGSRSPTTAPPTPGPSCRS